MMDDRILIFDDEDRHGLSFATQDLREILNEMGKKDIKIFRIGEILTKDDQDLSDEIFKVIESYNLSENTAVLLVSGLAEVFTPKIGIEKFLKNIDAMYSSKFENVNDIIGCYEERNTYLLKNAIGNEIIEYIKKTETDIL